MSHEVSNKTSFRVDPPAVPQLPLRVRSAGCYDVGRGWSEPKFQKWFIELTWIVSGTGEALMGEDTYTRLEAGDMFLYRPGDTHHMRALSERWRYCWVTFDHPGAERWIGELEVDDLKRGAGPCPEEEFRGMLEDLSAFSPEGERRAAVRAYRILLDAATPVRSEAPTEVSDRAKRMMEEEFMDPAFDVNGMAERLNVHRSTLFRHFTAAYHHKPSLYLLNLRLHRGLHLLQNTEIPIQEVALACGFSDASYFARSVRKATGKSPSGLRRHGTKNARRDPAGRNALCFPFP